MVRRGGRAPRGTDDRALIGFDLRKDARTLELAYDDPGGVTARFIRNILARINRELDGEFDLSTFAYRAEYRQDEGVVSMWLISERAQRVRIGALDLAVEFSAGETIHVENSYKSSAEEIDALARAAGLRVEGRWRDTRERFADVLFAPA